jgi:hypothetical protein
LLPLFIVHTGEVNEVFSLLILYGCPATKAVHSSLFIPLKHVFFFLKDSFGMILFSFYNAILIGFHIGSPSDLTSDLAGILVLVIIGPVGSGSTTSLATISV